MYITPNCNIPAMITRSFISNSMKCSPRQMPALTHVYVWTHMLFYLNVYHTGLQHPCYDRTELYIQLHDGMTPKVDVCIDQVSSHPQYSEYYPAIRVHYSLHIARYHPETIHFRKIQVHNDSQVVCRPHRHHAGRIDVRRQFPISLRGILPSVPEMEMGRQ